MVRVSSTADIPQSSPAAGTQPTSGTSEENGKNLKPLIYEILNRLAAQAFWPTVDAFVIRYKEAPFQALLLGTMFLLPLVPLSAIVAILLLFVTLATILLVITLQITLVCLSILVAVTFSVPSILELSASGIGEFAEELRALADRFFQFAISPGGSSRTRTNARSFSAYNAARAQGMMGFMRHKVLPKLSKPKVTLALLLAIVFLARRPCQCPTVECADPSVRDLIKHFVLKKL